jgi:hypothetical protein
LVSSLLYFYSLLADSLPSALVYVETREAELLLGEDGAGEVVVAQVVAQVMATIQGGLHPLIAAPAMMRVSASDLEVDLLHRVGDRVSGRERWVALQRDMRWDGVPVTTIVLPHNKEDHSLADRTIMMPERAARGHIRHRRSQPRQQALVLDPQDEGSEPGFAQYISWNPQTSAMSCKHGSLLTWIDTNEMEAVEFTTENVVCSNYETP